VFLSFFLLRQVQGKLTLPLIPSASSGQTLRLSGISQGTGCQLFLIQILKLKHLLNVPIMGIIYLTFIWERISIIHAGDIKKDTG
jgi:hypothetical protein